MTALVVAVTGLVAAWTLPALLASARWPLRYPRAGILAWALVLPATYGTVLAAALSLVLHLPPIAAALHAWLPGHTDALLRSYAHLGGRPLDAVVGGVAAAVVTGAVLAVVVSGRRTAADRRRHLADLGLVARPVGLPGVLVVDVAQPAAYAVPGRPGAVVLTSAARDALDPAELTAVLAHERTHLRARHARLLGVAATFARAGWLPGARDSHRSLRLLAELHADDAAARSTSPLVVAGALLKLGRGAAPEAGIGIGAVGMVTRVERLLERTVPRRRPLAPVAMAGAVTGLAAMLAIQLAVLAAPVATAAYDAATCDADCRSEPW
ncbi:M56 family metallopeptidase [Jiangella alba]|uniref:Zn-dependent protease with chaperone function n=1 Tax=Jiangella alba TaxID=561176 RepID=A0A1H5MIW7_9ACTN|nr:M56 family metallopeptidase [Jiangella alba]SEE89244.1 Zn-dependent protease with chaperone function [Jiangella alba]